LGTTTFWTRTAFRAAASTIVEAADTTNAITIAGSLSASEKVGIGAAVAFNDIHKTTEALIGNYSNNSTFGIGGSLTTAGSLILDARSDGFVGAFAVPGAYAGNDKTEGDQKTAGAIAVGFRPQYGDGDGRELRESRAGEYRRRHHDGAPRLSRRSKLSRSAGALARGNENSVALAGAGATNTVNASVLSYITASNDPHGDRRSRRARECRWSHDFGDGWFRRLFAGGRRLHRVGNGDDFDQASISIGASAALNEIGQGAGQKIKAYVSDSTVTATNGHEPDGACGCAHPRPRHRRGGVRGQRRFQFSAVRWPAPSPVPTPGTS
jgi:hypothetical protein